MNLIDDALSYSVRPKKSSAADWIIKNTTSKTKKEILSNYTFYSHVGNALALWRSTRAPVFWKEWEAKHPFKPKGADEVAVNDKAESAEPAAKDADGKPAETDAPTEDSKPQTAEETPAKPDADAKPQPLVVPPEL